MRLASSLFAAAPVTFALLRAVGTGDLRFAGIALASFLGATAIMRLGNARSRPMGAMLPLAFVAFVIATGLAVGTALLLGTGNASAALAVGAAFAFCWTASLTFDALSPRPAS